MAMVLEWGEHISIPVKSLRLAKRLVKEFLAHLYILFAHTPEICQRFRANTTKKKEPGTRALPYGSANDIHHGGTT